jgi:hypothetical protein
VSNSKRHLLCVAANDLLLLSFGTSDLQDLAGAQKSAEIPFGQPMKFEVLINLRTAKALALTIPPLMRMR